MLCVQQTMVAVAGLLAKRNAIKQPHDAVLQDNPNSSYYCIAYGAQIHVMHT
jgi:hypothetical protein